MDKLEFNNKKQCGLWLMAVGLVIVISTICGFDFLINPFVFLVGYYLFFFLINMNKKLRQKLSQGPISKFQIKMIYLSLILLFVLMFCVAGPFIPSWNWRLIWIGVFLATGIHFIPWFFIHGWSMLILALINIALCVSAYIVSSMPIPVLGYVIAGLDIAFGIYLFFFSQPSALLLKRANKENE